MTAALEAALWALATTDSFEQGALAAVNLGDDADTTGAIYGQLAGAIYGVEGIPESWREKIVMREEIEAMADRLLELSERDHRVNERLPNDAYWVTPGRLMAGPYPAAPDEIGTREKLQALTAVGVTHYLDLTEPGELNWDGVPLREYRPLLEAVLPLADPDAVHRRMPIRDVSVPTPAEMRAILDHLAGTPGIRRHRLRALLGWHRTYRHGRRLPPDRGGVAGRPRCRPNRQVESWTRQGAQALTSDPRAGRLRSELGSAIEHVAGLTGPEECSGS